MNTCITCRYKDNTVDNKEICDKCLEYLFEYRYWKSEKDIDNEQNEKAFT